MLLSFTIFITVAIITHCSPLPVSLLHAPIDYKICIEKMTDGCSVPSIGAKNEYTTLFLPACQRHDICYGCGETRNWTRPRCDLTLYNNMKTICHSKYRSKRSTGSCWSPSCWFNTFKKTFILGTNLGKWLFIPKNTLEHCLQGATIFYQAVDGFGGPYFGIGNQSLCYLPCMAPLGDPKNLI